MLLQGTPAWLAWPTLRSPACPSLTLPLRPPALCAPPSVRVVNNVVKKNEVKLRFHEAFKGEGYPEAFLYKQKVGPARRGAAQPEPCVGALHDASCVTTFAPAGPGPSVGWHMRGCWQTPTLRLRFRGPRALKGPHSRPPLPSLPRPHVPRRSSCCSRASTAWTSASTASTCRSTERTRRRPTARRVGGTPPLSHPSPAQATPLRSASCAFAPAFGCLLPQVPPQPAPPSPACPIGGQPQLLPMRAPLGAGVSSRSLRSQFIKGLSLDSQGGACSHRAGL